MAVVAGLVVLAASLSACGSPSKLSCQSYGSKDYAGKLNAVQAMMKQRHLSGTGALTELSVDGYCDFNPSGQIDGIYDG